MQFLFRRRTTSFEGNQDTDSGLYRILKTSFGRLDFKTGVCCNTNVKRTFIGVCRNFSNSSGLYTLPACSSPVLPDRLYR